jgi:capsular exopolysaccharide synthesis family protein
MSRIQDILAKAERDGTARRTQSETFTPAPRPGSGQAAPVPFPPAPSAPRVDGTSALDPFAPAAAGPAMPASAAPAVPIASAIAPATPTIETRTVTEAVEGRTASATLHPLLVAAINPHSPVAEQYRTLRSRISHREETASLRTLIVTSPGAGDGKSVTAANLALTMAQEFQRRVILVDADFRGSSVHSLFGVSSTPGLAELLTGEAALDDVMVYLPDYRLTIIPAGQTPQFPTELLGSTVMRRFVDTLRSRFDRMLFDVPAVAPLADVGTLAPLVDGVLMVVRAGITLRPALDQALGAFDEHKVVGVVLNDAK